MSNAMDSSQALSRQAMQAFMGDGKEYFVRYLVASGWKELKDAEVQLATELGAKIVSVYETTASRALGGYQAGLTDGQAAIQVAKDRGQPEGTVIFFAVDFDATDVQMATVIDYIRGASEATPYHPTGVYGSARVIKAMKEACVCSYFWQTYAWSRGEKVDGIHMFQFLNDVTEHGMIMDHDEVYDDAIGWNLNTVVAPPAPPAPTPLTNYPDIEAGRWSEVYIQFVSTWNIMNGYEDGMFRPEQSVTRAELAKVSNDVAYILKEKGALTLDEKAMNFPDVAADHWSAPAIESVAGLGIMDGYPDGTFKPEQAVTREELAKVVAKLLTVG